MIQVLLRDLRWRLLFLVGAMLFLVWQEWETQAHAPPGSVEIGPLGLSAPMSYLAGLTVITLLAGFISSDRREGYTRLFFSHPTSPLAFYGVRWALAVTIAIGFAILFLFTFQLLVWNELRGGWIGISLAIANTLIYGGLMAFLSAALPRGDAWVALFLFLSTLVSQPLTLLLSLLPTAPRQLVLLLLPPHTTALQRVYESILESRVAWDAMAFSAVYGLVFLGLAALILRLREWP